MKYLKRVLFLLIVFVMFIPFVHVEAIREKNLVNIYLFYSDSCMHCANEKEFLNEVVSRYDNVKVYKYEVSNNPLNKEMMMNIGTLLDVPVNGVPFTIIADKPYKGFDKNLSRRVFLGTIDYYSEHRYTDIVGETIGGIELPSYGIEDTDDFYEYLDNYGNYKISFLGLEVDTKDNSLMATSIMLGLLDGINIGIVLVIWFLVNILMHLKDKKNIWYFCMGYLGLTGIIYLMIVIFGLNISANIVKIVLGLILIVIGILTLLYNKIKNSVCCNKIKDIVNKNNYLVIIIGVLLMLMLTSIIEIVCNRNISLMFMDILFLSSGDIFEIIINILVYMLFFLLDDFIILFIFMMILNSKKFNEKKRMFLGTILVFVVILLLIVKPEFLLF